MFVSSIVFRLHSANMILLGQLWANVLYVVTLGRRRMPTVAQCFLLIVPMMARPFNCSQTVANVQPMLVQGWPSVIKCITRSDHCWANIARQLVFFMGTLLNRHIQCIVGATAQHWRIVQWLRRLKPITCYWHNIIQQSIYCCIIKEELKRLRK